MDNPNFPHSDSPAYFPTPLALPNPFGVHAGYHWASSRTVSAVKSRYVKIQPSHDCVKKCFLFGPKIVWCTTPLCRCGIILGRRCNNRRIGVSQILCMYSENLNLLVHHQTIFGIRSFHQQRAGYDHVRPNDLELRKYSKLVTFRPAASTGHYDDGCSELAQSAGSSRYHSCSSVCLVCGSCFDLALPGNRLFNSFSPTTIGRH
jgi:hypothetical protein